MIWDLKKHFIRNGSSKYYNIEVYKKKRISKKDYIEKSSATSVKNLENGRFYPCKNKYLKHIYIWSEVTNFVRLFKINLIN